MTPLQRDIAEFNRGHVREITAALLRCRNEYQREQCIAAYGDLSRKIHDQIAAQHGHPPMVTHWVGLDEWMRLKEAQ